MSRFVQKIILFVVLYCLVAAPLSLADVKLRIYLQDGSLKAGNLIAESEKAFVILSKSGREEIPKDKIMFVNGKTLAQWQARPDKLFQTEIIPSDIPNPSYVNDKASIPSLPPATEKPVLSKSAEVSNSQAENVEVPKNKVSPSKVEPVESPVPVAPKKVKTLTAKQLDLNPDKSLRASSKAVSEKPSPSPTPAASVVSQESDPVENQVAAVPASKKQEVLPVPEDEKPLSVEEVVANSKKALAGRYKNGIPPKEEKKPAGKFLADVKKGKQKILKKEEVAKVAASSPLKVDRASKPAIFTRESYANYHKQMGKGFIEAGRKGPAIQELHIAMVLNKGDAETAMMLGKLYAEEGVDSRAEKFLTHFGLKKDEAAKNLITSIKEERASAEKKKKILYAEAASGLLLEIPVLILYRRFRRKKGKVVEIDAETVQVPQQDLDKLDKEETKDVFKDALVEIEKIKAVEPPPLEIKTTPLEKTEAKQIPPPPPTKAPAFPAAPPQFKVEMPAKIELPVNEPPKEFNELHPVAEYEDPQEIDESQNVEKPTALRRPVFKTKGFSLNDKEEFLKVGKIVEAAVQKGNQLAFEGRFDEARREYRTALALHYVCLEAYLGLGYLSFAQGQWELALEHYLRAVEINAESADAHYGLGRVLLELEQSELGVEELQKALTLDPSLIDARDTLTALGKAA